MLVKFFDVKNGGSTASIDYLLDNRTKKGTSRIIKGNESITRGIINSITNKQKTCVGCLSFEEENLPEAQKYELMRDFENMLMPEMQGRYNILWVEHTDKGRLELNFVIPKIDLETRKSLNPYYHAVDFKRVDAWQDLTNLTYDFSDPKDPMKAREGIVDSQVKKKNLFTEYHQIDKMLKDFVKEGVIQNRTHMIDLLKNTQGITLTRIGDDYISIKLENQPKAKRFKGGIYGNNFKDIRALERDFEKRTREYSESRTQTIRELREKCNKLIKSKIDFYTKQNRIPRRNVNEREIRDSNFTKDIQQLDSRGNVNDNNIYDNSLLQATLYQEFSRNNIEVLDDEPINNRDYERYDERIREIRERIREIRERESDIKGQIVRTGINIQRDFESQIARFRERFEGFCKKTIDAIVESIMQKRAIKQESIQTKPKTIKNDFRGNSDSNTTIFKRRR